MEQVKAEPRKLYLDALRILAMLLVIFNHTGSFGFFRFVETQNPVLYWIYLAGAVFCTMGVPLFFMISGVLLLLREESIATVYKKRVLRILLTLLVFSVIQYLYQVRFQNVEFSIPRFLRTIYTDQIVAPYWFLYAYLGFLMMLPLLRAMVRGMERPHYRYLLVLSVVFLGVLPVVQYLLLHDMVYINLALPLVTTTSLFYSVMGDYFERRLLPEEAVSRRRLIYYSIGGVICIFTSMGMTHLLGIVSGELSEARSQTFLACLIAVPAIAVFLLVKKLFSKGACPRPLAVAIRSMGGCTFGIYLLHAMLMDRLMPVLYYFQERLDTLPACLIYVLAVFLCGYGITWVLKRIPLVRKLV